ncbi:MAG TPA: glycosyltransferase family 39 protein [Thermoanaerobaculia bacterium]|nr:glycosyltransferase family 39 protein [Thermoanaerobaculia bacterium]
MTRVHSSAFVAVLIAAAFLRLHNVGEPALNNDEIAEVQWSSGSLPEMFEMLRHDKVHPPLDYLVQYVIGKAGAPEWVRRLPPALFSIATVGFLMLLGRWWHSPAAGLLAGIFLAVSPMHVRYSQEVRPYAMGVFFLAGSLAALELYAMTGRRRWAVTWSASVFLAGATLYMAGVVAVIASAARLLASTDTFRPLLRRAPLIVLGWTILYAPWLGVVISAARRPPPAAAERLNWPWWQHRLQAFGTGTEFYEPISIGSWALWLSVLIGLLAAIRIRLLRTAALWILGGGAATIIILQLRPHYAFVPRYFLPAMTAAAILAGAGLVTLARWWPGRAAAPVVLAAYLLFAGITLVWYYDHGRSDWRAVARYVHERVRPGETVILTNNWVIRNFGFYWLRLPERDGVNVERFVAGSRDVTGPVWVVTGHCRPGESLETAGMMWRHEPTEQAKVYYVRPGEDLPISRELCAEL